MNAAGLDFNGVGNHEFDRGVADSAHAGRRVSSERLQIGRQL